MVFSIFIGLTYSITLRNTQCLLSLTSMFYNKFTICSIFYSIVLVVIAARCTATFFKIYCAPPNLGISLLGREYAD